MVPGGGEAEGEDEYQEAPEDVELQDALCNVVQGRAFDWFACGRGVATYD